MCHVFLISFLKTEVIDYSLIYKQANQYLYFIKSAGNQTLEMYVNNKFINKDLLLNNLKL